MQTPSISNKNVYQFMQSILMAQESTPQKQLRQLTSKLKIGAMNIAPEQAQFLQFLIKTHRYTNILEIGTFTGYSALSMALALPIDGHITCIDINPKWTALSIPIWKKAKVSSKITLRVAPAKELLVKWQVNGPQKHYDMVFIDADKTHSINYLELVLPLLAPNGLVVIDNIFWGGKIIEPEKNRQTKAINNLIIHINQMKNIHSTIVPLADGMYLISKR